MADQAPPPSENLLRVLKAFPLECPGLRLMRNKMDTHWRLDDPDNGPDGDCGYLLMDFISDLAILRHLVEVCDAEGVLWSIRQDQSTLLWEVLGRPEQYSTFPAAMEAALCALLDERGKG